MLRVDADALRGFRSEIITLSDLRHSNIVMLVGAVWEQSLMALVMEYCAKGTSSDLLESDGSSEDMTWDITLLPWCQDCARAMKYLHGVSYFDSKVNASVHGIVHRDLKPDNCLVSESNAIKIADFGEARALSIENTMTQVGTPLYIAPEIVKGDRYANSCDVFSFAFTVLTWGLTGKSKIWEVRWEERRTAGAKRQHQ